MKTKEELDSKIKEIKDFFGDVTDLNGSISDLRKFFRKYFNNKIIHKGSHGVFDFTSLMSFSKELYKMFNGDPIQPFTVTYIRCDIVFYKYDKAPKEEHYIEMDAPWMNVMYLDEIKQSELFKKKEFLKKKNPDEWYIQVKLFDIKNKYTKYIKDISLD